MLKPRPIYELLDYHFIIPPYQRGYRWDKEQVDDLLDDLKKFVTDIAYKEVNGLKDKAYYCLQPIAVVPLDRNNPDNDTFYVIDGQQRLTTLYLLLQFLRPDSDYKNSSIFSLKMDARDIQQEFIDSEAYKKEESNFAANIDCFYIQTAYNTILILYSTLWLTNSMPRSQMKTEVSPFMSARKKLFLTPTRTFAIISTIM